MDAELLDLARTVDLTALGARVKAARLAKRLTQTEVAGAEMSTAYVSRIESGQRRPDPGLLEVIASRVDVSVDQLVLGTSRDTITEARLALVSAEVEMRTGDAHAALRRVDETLMDLAGHGQHALHRETLRLKAAALEATGRLDEAIIMLEDLTESAEPDTLWVTDMTRLCRCYRVSGDLAQAVVVGERARSAIRDHELDGTAEATELTLSLAAALSERGDTARATRLSRRAIDQAEGLDLRMKGSTYWVASIMESRRGHSEAALNLAHKALAHLEMSDDHRMLASVRTQLGVLMLRCDETRPALALATLQRAEAELVSSDAMSSVRATNLVAQARAQIMMGEMDVARSMLRSAMSLAQAKSPLVVADALVVEGQIHLDSGDRTTARETYRQAATVLSGTGADRGAAQLWFELATRLESLDDMLGAMDAFKRAGAATGLAAIDVTSSRDVASAPLSAARSV